MELPLQQDLNREEDFFINCRKLHRKQESFFQENHMRQQVVQEVQLLQVMEQPRCNLSQQENLHHRRQYKGSLEILQLDHRDHVPRMERM